MMIDLDAKNLARAVRAGWRATFDHLDPVTGAVASTSPAAKVASAEQGLERADKASVSKSQQGPPTDKGVC